METKHSIDLITRYIALAMQARFFHGATTAPGTRASYDAMRSGPGRPRAALLFELSAASAADIEGRAAIACLRGRRRGGSIRRVPNRCCRIPLPPSMAAPDDRGRDLGNRAG